MELDVKQKILLLPREVVCVESANTIEQYRSIVSLIFITKAYQIVSVIFDLHRKPFCYVTKRYDY